MAHEVIETMQRAGHQAALQRDGSILVIYTYHKGCASMEGRKFFTPSTASKDVNLYRAEPIRVFLGEA